MNRNSVIGWVLIALIMIGFMWYQSKEIEKQQAYQAKLDSAAAVEMMRQAALDSAQAVLAASDTTGTQVVVQAAPVQPVYKDSLLEAASSGTGETIVLRNDKMELALNTRGAQPLSARLEGYSNYDGSELYLFKEGDSELGYSVFTGEYINTKDFLFTVAEVSDTVAVMRLPFAGGGYIEQEYALSEGSYSVRHRLSFVGMDKVIPRNVSALDVDWKLTVPRMEKGFRGESQYSKVDYRFAGEDKISDFGKGKSGSKRIENRLDWFAFQQQFFTAIMHPHGGFSSGDLGVTFFTQEDPSHNLMTCKASMRQDFTPAPSVTYETDFYFGPSHYWTLKSYHESYEKIIPLGGWLIGWFSRLVIIPTFNWLHRFISNFGIIILLMTLLIKLIVLPFSYKSYSSSAKMQVLKPEIDKLNEKYPKQDDAMKKQQATMDLYRRAGVSPMGGCLPMLLQFPILWAMFRFFPASIELRQQPFLWAEDLSTYDSIVSFPNIPLLGDHISLFALLMAASMFFYSKITMQGQASGNDPNAATMRFMSVWMMPIMMFFICNSLSSGLSWYYLLSNLVTMVETWVIRKWFVHPEDIYAKLKASEGKPVQKSKWQQRLEEAQKMQRQAQAQQKNSRR